MTTTTLSAGAAVADLCPDTPQFLYGYPHTPRTSEGVHDPILSSALALSDGRVTTVIIANDLIWVPRDIGTRARKRIGEAVGVPAEHIIITASHTHSGPIVGEMLVAEADPTVPKPDPAYGRKLEEALVQVGIAAVRGMEPARAGLVIADAAMVGTNRRDPQGPALSQAPVLAVQSADGGRWIALMVVCSMHPTVLHEDSRLVSGDFPGLMRAYLQQQVTGPACPVVYHMGAAGNQSPRHVTRGNTFAEAQRLGFALGASIQNALRNVTWTGDLPLSVRRAEVTLPLRKMPAVAAAEARRKTVHDRLQHLRTSGAPRTEVRTAECDWFGAEETVTLARAQADGRLEALARQYNPLEISAIAVGPWTFVGWPGEVFVEFALTLRKQLGDNTFVMTLADSETQGYLVTAEAVAEGGYEASNAMFASPDSAELLVRTTVELMKRTR